MHQPVAPIGTVDFRHDRRTFGLRRADRRYHLLVVGRTGTGKSTLLANMVRGDVEAGEGVALFDPHGDLAEHLARSTGSRRRVVHFRPGTAGNELTFNPLYTSDPDQRHLVVSELIAVFQQIWDRAWGSRLEHILRVVLLTLTERPGYTLLDALRLLNDGGFRAAVVDDLEDPVLLDFWLNEFSQYSKSHRTEALAPIQNKLSEFAVNPAVATVFKDPKGSINPRQIMDEGDVFIADLAVGRIGRDVCRLLGATLVGKFALARAHIGRRA